MKALIFNSGLGKRMGPLTQNHPKCLVKLYNNETILERQLRILQESGINNIIITTGPFSNLIKDICNSERFKNIHFHFVNNELYDSTNYIYSMYKAQNLIDEDVLILHGDLVFDRKVIINILKSKKKNLVLIDKYKKLPLKDFKGRIENNNVVEVGINIFDKNCYSLQPIYKLDFHTVSKWIDSINNFITNKITNVYAENALNVIGRALKIEPFYLKNYFVDEIDNENDLKRVSNRIKFFDYKYQTIIYSKNFKNSIREILKKCNLKRPLVVCDKYFLELLKKDFENIFVDFSPNPDYHSVISGIKIFKSLKCDSIIAIGGGSCIDVAKTIKLYLNSDITYDRLPDLNDKFNCINLISVPTSIGTGSESTKHAVIYLNNEKQSISNDIILPNYVILDPNLIVSLPKSQRISTSLDSLCQCLESYISVKGNLISKTYADKGILLFERNYKNIFSNDLKFLKSFQKISNYSGKAINISETTAGHALSYKITSLYGISHGYAVALCMNVILKQYNDLLPKHYSELFFKYLNFIEFHPYIKSKEKDSDIEQLISCIHFERLKNFPIPIKENDITEIYKKIVL